MKKQERKQNLMSERKEPTIESFPPPPPLLHILIDQDWDPSAPQLCEEADF